MQRWKIFDESDLIPECLGELKRLGIDAGGIFCFNLCSFELI
jgi:hypothetical protein